MSAAQRNRGARAEVQVVNYLRSVGYPDARRYLAGDGRQPGDIDWHPLVCLEVKDVAASSWPSWCRQAAAEAPPGTIPMVVRRTRGAADPGLWECRVQGWRWFTVTDTSPFDLPGAVEHFVRQGDGDDWPWIASTFAAVIAAVRALDGAR